MVQNSRENIICLCTPTSVCVGIVSKGPGVEGWRQQERACSWNRGEKVTARWGVRSSEPPSVTGRLCLLGLGGLRGLVAGSRPPALPDLWATAPQTAAGAPRARTVSWHLRVMDVFHKGVRNERWALIGVVGRLLWVFTATVFSQTLKGE